MRKTADALPWDKTDFTFSDLGEIGSYTDPLVTLGPGDELAITLDTAMITAGAQLWLCLTSDREYITPTQPTGYEVIVVTSPQLLLNGAARA
jgi:hypothetical protein